MLDDDKILPVHFVRFMNHFKGTEFAQHTGTEKMGLETVSCMAGTLGTHECENRNH